MSLKILYSIIDNPIPFAHALGFTKLKEDPHKEWIRSMFFMDHDQTIQAHRGSYKTTCLIVALTLRMIAMPHRNNIFLRKTDDAVKDVVNAVAKALTSSVCQMLMKDIYGSYQDLIVRSNSELQLSCARIPMGRQLVGQGVNATITGTHGSIFTDDIITTVDRISTAAREKTIYQYQELHNIASEDEHFIFNTGTPWHKDDAFTKMPKPKRWTCYDTGIMSPEKIEEKKELLSESLFAANYELKHVADGDILFKEPKYGQFPHQGGTRWAHIDAAFGGEDSNALTIAMEADDNLYVKGWKFEGHIDLHYQAMINLMQAHQVRQWSVENNADKGYVYKELTQKTYIPGHKYHESMNKYLKISSYGREVWNRVIMDISGGEKSENYVEGIMDYNETMKHDDCPDSFSSLVRWKFSRTGGIKARTRRKQ